MAPLAGPMAAGCPACASAFLQCGPSARAAACHHNSGPISPDRVGPLSPGRGVSTSLKGFPNIFIYVYVWHIPPQTYPLPGGLDRGGREGLDIPREPKMAPTWLKIAQDSVRVGARWSTMVQDGLQHAPKRRQDVHKTARCCNKARQGGPREAKIIEKPCVFQCFLAFELFASDGLRRPQVSSKKAQVGPTWAQDGPKTAPRRPQDGPKMAQDGA